MKLEKGRPQDCEGREAKEIAVYDLLDSLRIPYDRVDHEAAFTMEQCEAVDQILGITMCKNLFLCNQQKTVFYLFLIRADKKFETKKFSAALEISRVSFAEDEFLLKYLNITPGSVSVLGLMNDTENAVHLVIDRDVLNEEFIGCHPCVNTSSLKLRTEDLMTFLRHVDHSFLTIDF